MDKEKIREYAELMKELGLTGIEINEKKGTIRLERQPGTCDVSSTTPAAAGKAGAEGHSAALSDGSRDAPDALDEAIVSPMVGVFYNAPSKDAEPFVHPGDAVKKGQVVCIIESMKLMNEIQADEDCVIGQVLVGDGTPVEYGTKLFAVTA